MKTKQIKYRQWMGTEWRYWGFIDGIFVAPIQGIEDSYQLLPLTDKNGNEMWEGDIIKIYPEGDIREIIWDPFLLKFISDEKNSGHDELPPYFFGEKSEVVGNIKENPELLQELK